MTITRNKFFKLLAWLQLFTSLSLASAIVWGYVSYQASFGQFINSISASIIAVSNVVIRTAETVESRRDLLDQTGNMLSVTKKLINEFKITAENQAKIAPQYAEGLRSAATVAGRLSGILESVADGILFSVPTGIRMQGMTPVVIISRPLEKQARELKLNSQDIKVISEILSEASQVISRDGQNLGSTFIATCEQALKVISEAEKALGQIKMNDLPKTIEDLKTTSEKLRNIGVQVDIVGNVGLALLVIGLLLAVWCFFNSLGSLMLASSKTLTHETGKIR